MSYKDVITLVSVTSTRNKNGYPVTEESREEVYADIQSAKRQEFYEAYRSGLSITIVFVVFTYDYHKQKYVDYGGIRYRVVRVYNKGDRTELNCEEVKSHDADDE